MYINEVIREADALNPNEYTLNEKYTWIDELNATLMQEHMYKYARAELEPMEDGTYLLPEGITFEMVDRIIAQGRSIEKYDFRSFGITPLYTPRERFFVPVHCQAKGAITVIYLAQYEPIRTANATGTLIVPNTDDYYDFGEYDVSTGTSENYIGVGNIGFEIPDVGDTVKFSVNEDCSEVMLPFTAYSYNVGNSHIRVAYNFKKGKTYYANVTKQSTYDITPGPHTVYKEVTPTEATVVKLSKILTDDKNIQSGDALTMTIGATSYAVNVEGVRVEDNLCALYLLEKFDYEFSDTECTIERVVTEQTLVPAPYDRMYIDWILAKIAFYQRNYIVYNQQMNKFYNTLRQFDNWRISRAPADKDNKIRNWMK